jgi:hypothetical protein
VDTKNVELEGILSALHGKFAENQARATLIKPWYSSIRAQTEADSS